MIGENWIAGKPAVYIGYQLQTGPAGLLVTPDSVAVASGGVQVDYKKVTFYYRTVEGYKVVTWCCTGAPTLWFPRKEMTPSDPARSAIPV